RPHARPAGGVRRRAAPPLDKLTPEHLNQAYSTMLESGLSPSTVLKVHRVLSRALKIAVRRSKVAKNVATLIDAPVANDPDLVFATRHGKPMERSEDYKAWKALLKRAGVRDARLHDARHTAGTLLVEQSVHIRVVQEILGHARVTTTERYTHVAGALMQDASTRMGAALRGDG
ncbi:tyrosine-type recombinase/integrase, partial [Streptosporangium amethystogenes]